MRKLIVMRGLPGSGKSHTLDSLGLTDVTIGADTLRLLLASPVLRPDGRMAISPEQDGRVWKQIYEILGQRMARGEVVVVDATHPTEAEFTTYLELAREHRYAIACLDFAEVPPDVSMWGNDGRAEHRVVPPQAVERISARMAASRVPESVHRIVVRSDRSHLKEARAWLEEPVAELDRDYARVVHVGDVQGCHTALMALLGGGLRDDTFYVFVGDYCDRGEENGAVMRWLLDHALGRPNVALLRGNHEHHLDLEARGLPPVSGEFGKFTLPQLKAAGVTAADLDAFCDGLRDMFMYRFGRHGVLVTHGGLPTVPANPWMVPSRQCTAGTGFYEDDVDSQFARNAPPGWTQVHGHRNHHARPILAARNSVNLEGAVEAGGHLRGVVLDRDGWHPVAVANEVFRPFRERRHRKEDIVPPWMARPDDGEAVFPAAEIDAMLAHRLGNKPAVRAKASDSFPHVVSLNFDKNVFYQSAWDDITTKARGLFLSRLDGGDFECVARSYDKFFNTNEKDDHLPEALAARLAFPVVGYLKENGFLGIQGYDRRTDSLFTTSKSTPDSDFARWFRDIAHDTLGEGRLDAMRRFLRDCEASGAYEVIDPVNDPHIIEYDRPKIVLLDLFRRSRTVEKLPYDDLVRFGKRFGIEVKERSVFMKDWRALSGWMNRVGTDIHWTWKGKPVEGFVMEDANGFQFKVKSAYYTFWKQMRGVKDRVARVKEQGGDLRSIQPVHDDGFKGWVWQHPEATAFLEWIKVQDAERLKAADIISLRGEFLALHGVLDPTPDPEGAPIGPRLG